METKLVRCTIKFDTASGGRKSWYKHVTSVDKSKDNGYSLIGEFLREGEIDLPLGAVIVEKCPAGSVKHSYDIPNCGVVTESGLEWLDSPGSDWRKHFLSFRDFVAEEIERQRIAQSEVSPRDEAIAKIKALMEEFAITADSL